MGFKCPYGNSYDDNIKCDNYNPCAGKMSNGVCIYKVQNKYPEIYKAVVELEETNENETSSYESDHSALYYIILYIIAFVSGAVIVSILL